MLDIKFPMKLMAGLLCIPLLLVGCSSGTDDVPVIDTNNLVGRFLDAPVKGLEYVTSPSGKTGVTNEAGEYDYEAGDTVKFLVKGISIGEVDASPEVPVTALPKYVAIAQILQTLDTEPNNDAVIDISKIVIPADIGTALEAFITSDAETQANIEDVLSVENLQAIETASINASSDNTIDLADSVVSEEDAVIHLSATLIELFTEADIAKQTFYIVDDENEAATLYFLEGGSGYVFDHQTSSSDGATIPATKDVFGWSISDGKLVINDSDETVTVTLHSITDNSYATTVVESDEPNTVYPVVFEKVQTLSLASVANLIFKDLDANSSCSMVTREFSADGTTGMIKSLCGDTNQYNADPITLSEVAALDNVIQVSGTDSDGSYSVLASLVAGDLAGAGSMPEFSLTSLLDSVGVDIDASLDKFEVVSEAVQEPVVTGGFAVEDVSRQVFTRTGDNESPVIVVFNENNTGTEFQAPETSSDSASTEDFTWAIENGFLNIDYPNNDDVSVKLASVSGSTYSVTVTEATGEFNDTIYKVKSLAQADLAGKILSLTDASEGAGCEQRSIKFTDTGSGLVADMKEICGGSFYEASGFAVGTGTDFDNVVTLSISGSQGTSYIVLRDGDLSNDANIDLGLVFDKGEADIEAVLFENYALTDEELVEPVTGPNFDISDVAKQVYVSLDEGMVLAFENGGRGTEFNDGDGDSGAGYIHDFSWSIVDGRLINNYDADSTSTGSVTVEVTEVNGNLYTIKTGETADSLTDVLTVNRALPLSIADLGGKIISLDMSEDSSCSEMTFAFTSTGVNRVGVCTDVEGGIESESFTLAENSDFDNVVTMSGNDEGESFELSMILVDGSIASGQGKVVFVGLNSTGGDVKIPVHDMILVNEEATLPEPTGDIPVVIGSPVFFDDGTNSSIKVAFSEDMMDSYQTTGSYDPRNSYWVDSRTFVIDFNSYAPNGSITFVAAGFMTVGRQVLAEDYTFTFPQTEPLIGSVLPNASESDVTSLFSDSYQSNTVGAAEFSTEWDQAEVSDVVIGGNVVKKYDMNVDGGNPFAGIDFSENPVDGTGFTHMRLDVWTTDVSKLEVRLVDFNGTGWNGDTDNSEGVKLVDLDATQGSWVSLDIPFSEFVGLSGTSELAQILLKTTEYDATSTLYVDNLYFYNDGSTVPVTGNGVLASLIVGKKLYHHVSYDGQSVINSIEFLTDGTMIYIENGQAEVGSTYRIDGDVIYTAEVGRAEEAHPMVDYTTTYVKFSDDPQDANDTTTFHFTEADAQAAPVDYEENSGTVPTALPQTSSQLSSDVISVYSDTYASIAGVNTNPNWGQATLTSEESIAANSVLKLADLNYQGIDFDGNRQNVSCLGYLHVDYWTADSSSLQVFLIGDKGEAAYDVGVVIPGSWQSLEIPLTHYDAVGLYQARQLKFAGNGTLYLDNMYFYGNTGEGTNCPVEPADLVPMEAPAAPTQAATDVTSIYSDAYTDVDTSGAFPTSWSQATLETEIIAGNAVQKMTGGFIGLEPVTPIDGSSHTHLNVDVWAAGGTSILFKVRDYGPDGEYDGGDDSEILYTHMLSTASAWENVSIPLTNATKASLKQIVIDAANADSLIYFDNVYFSSDSGSSTPTEPTAAAPAPTQSSSDVVSVYSDTYAAIAGVNTNPDWGQSTVTTEEDVAGNNVLKLAGLNYQGIDFDGNQQNVSCLTHLHVDYWSADAAVLQTFLIGNKGETSYDVPVTTGSWQSIDIPLAIYDSVGLYNARQFKFEGNGTVYLDNLYFYGNAGSGTSCPAEPAAPMPTDAPAAPIQNQDDVTSLYSDAYNDVDTTGAFPTGWSAASLAEENIVGNNVQKMTGGFIGLEPAVAIDGTAYSFLNVDVWVAEGSSVLFKVRDYGSNGVHDALDDDIGDANDDSEIAYTHTLDATGSWESVSIPLTNATKASLKQIVIDSANAGSLIYFDNVYFH